MKPSAEGKPVIDWVKQVGIDHASRQLGISKKTVTSWATGKSGPSQDTVDLFHSLNSNNESTPDTPKIIPAKQIPNFQNNMELTHSAPSAPRLIIRPQPRMAARAVEQHQNISKDAHDLGIQPSAGKMTDEGSLDLRRIETPSEVNARINLERLNAARASGGMTTAFTKDMQEREIELPPNFSTLPNALASPGGLDRIPVQRSAPVDGEGRLINSPPVAPNSRPEMNSTVQPLRAVQPIRSPMNIEPNVSQITAPAPATRNGVMSEEEYKRMKNISDQKFSSGGQQFGVVVPTAQSNKEFAYKRKDSNGTETPWLALCLPCYKGTNFVTAQTWIELGRSMGYQMRVLAAGGDAIIENARNSIARKFLDQTDCEWSLWMDDDMIPPVGNAQWLRESASMLPDAQAPFAGLNFVERLLSHGKTLVGATYFGRKPNGMPVMDSPNRQAIRSKARSFSNEIVEVDWVGTGCMLIHRSVFESIQDTHPGIAPTTENENSSVGESKWVIDEMTLQPVEIQAFPTLSWGFFNKVAGWGEDVSFCRRARNAGHPVYADLGLHALHVGFACYGAHNVVDIPTR